MEMETEMEMEDNTVAVHKKEEEEMTTMRIFVGGLGEKVTEDDLHKTFSSLGTVKDVDFVRTNDRSFAYIDFHPSSHKSLSKLFSSYNGCVWKGGRLRLEKAKEHYLVRLRREWEEDAELAHKTNDKPVAVADENKDISKKSKLLTLEKKQLQIFFPKIRKVKSVPYSGTGKHKYSFQRIEVPALPIHFCDCEEHCVSSEIAKVKQISDVEDQAGNVNEEELNMMRSVMNKIFKREDNLKTECSKVIMSTEAGSSNQSIDDFPPNESDADQEDDADNLVINIVSGGNTKSGLMENGRVENASKESNFGKHRLVNVGSTQNKIKSQNEKSNDLFNFSDTVSKKNPRLLLSDESNRNEFTSTMAKKKGHPETYSKESTGLLAAQPDRKGSSQQLPTRLPWKQKSSWRELVGGTANGSFSISHVLPDANLKQNLTKSSGSDISRTSDSKQQKLRKHARCKSASSEPKEVTKDEILQDEVSIDVLSIDTKKLMKQGRHESAGSEPVGLVMDEILQDKVITDGPSLETEKLMNQGRFESTDSEPVGLVKDEILQDKVSIEGPSIGTEKLMKQGRFDPTGSDPAGLAKDEISQDKVSTDGTSIGTEKLMKQGRCASAGSEPVGLTEGEILQDKVCTDGPLIGTKKLMKQGRCESAGSEPVGLTNDEILQDKVSTDGPSIVAQSGTPSKESESPEEVQPTDKLAGKNQTERGRSWIHKSSWRELVGKMDTSSFSISNILPDIASKRQKLENHNSTETVNPFDNKQQSSTKQVRSEFIGSGFNMASSAKRKETLVGLEGGNNRVEKNMVNDKMDNTESSKSYGGKSISVTNKKARVDIGIGEVCTFMRSKESEKEWTKVKAALSGALKRKTDEK